MPPYPVTESSTFTSPINVPQDLIDGATVASLLWSVQGLVNRTRWLYNEIVTNGTKKIRTATDVATMKALTSLAAGQWCYVPAIGLFVLETESVSLLETAPWRYTSTTPGLNWIAYPFPLLDASAITSSGITSYLSIKLATALNGRLLGYGIPGYISDETYLSAFNGGVTSGATSYGSLYVGTTRAQSGDVANITASGWMQSSAGGVLRTGLQYMDVEMYDVASSTWLTATRISAPTQIPASSATQYINAMGGIVAIGRVVLTGSSPQMRVKAVNLDTDSCIFNCDVNIRVVRP